VIWLASGVVLWSGAHLFKRIAPDARARLDNAGRPLMAVFLVGSVVLMTLGYQQDSTTMWWGRQTPWVGVNNVLVYLGFYFIAGSQVGARVVGVIRHPQLTAVKLWAAAHLLVNGDSASLLLFGGLLVWAVLEVVIINQQDGKPRLNKPQPSLLARGCGDYHHIACLWRHGLPSCTARLPRSWLTPATPREPALQAHGRRHP